MGSENLYAPCKRCGKQVRKDEKNCPECGAKQSKIGTYIKVSVGLFVGFIVLVALLSPGDNRKTSAGSSKNAAKSESSAPALPAFPKKQGEFISIVEVARNEFRNAKNQIMKEEARSSRAANFRTRISGFTVKNWKGVIASFDTTNDGDVTFSVKIKGSFAEFKTWNNSISDVGDRTIIPKGGKLYQSIRTLSKGDEVLFSGRILKNTTDYFKESSLTIAGSMTSPEFLFKFSSITSAE